MKRKNGWGLAMMIFLMSILLVALLAIVIMVYQLNVAKEKTNGNYNTKQVEYVPRNN